MPPRTLYDRLAPIYDLLAAPEAAIRRAAVRLLAPQPGERILELGSGTGQALQSIADACGPTGLALGLDLSWAMCHRAAGRLRGDHAAGWLVLQSDARHLPVQSHALHGALAVLTLETLPLADLPLALSRCRDVLVPGGRLVVASISAEGRGPIHHLYGWAHKALPRLVDCRPIHVADELARAGWAVRQVERVSLMGLTVDLVLASRA